MSFNDLSQSFNHFHHVPSYKLLNSFKLVISFLNIFHPFMNKHFEARSPGWFLNAMWSSLPVKIFGFHFLFRLCKIQAKFYALARCSFCSNLLVCFCRKFSQTFSNLKSDRIASRFCFSFLSTISTHWGFKRCCWESAWFWSFQFCALCWQRT